jgi:hypothetical protein
MKFVNIFKAAAILLIMLISESVWAASNWETGLRVGFDSNVNRAIADEKSDSFAGAYLSLSRSPTGDSRLDWIFGATVEGAAYKRYSDLDYGLINLSPGLVYVPHRIVSLTVSPFFEARAAKNTDQSSLATGGKVMVREQLLPNLYLGQYYLFRASSAKEDVYSFTEHALGIFSGLRLSQKTTVEIGYEFSHGDSFRSFDSPATTGGARGRGRGGRQTFSTVFQDNLFREAVNRNSVGINLNVDWNTSIFSSAGFTYVSASGDSGTSTSQIGYVTLGYRF